MFCLSLCLAELCIFNSFKLSLLINAISPLIILELFFEHRPAGFHKAGDEQPAADAVFQGPSPHLVSECSAPNHSSLILCHIITETNVLFSAFFSSYVFGIPACVSFLPLNICASDPFCPDVRETAFWNQRSSSATLAM